MLIEDLKLVLKVAELGSITAAAESLDLSNATASAGLKRIEKQLGTSLFIRSTRRLRLSQEGERFIPQCESALKILDDATNSLFDRGEELTGELRISVSSDFGRNILMPWLSEFMTLHPKLKIRISISDSTADFYRESVDAALRYGEPNDTSMYGFKIADIPRYLCASPDYLSKHAEPMFPDQLKHHNALFYQLHDVLHNKWEFIERTNGQRHKVKLDGNRAANDGDLVRRWCVSGDGVALKSALDISSDLLSGALIPIMKDFEALDTQLWIICPSKQSISPAVRLLRDYLRMKTSGVLEQLSKLSH